MKKILILAVVAAAIPGILSAQVDKRVEVTKAYVPSVESASKLAIAPDMTDTTRMRPEIDYTITPLSLQTTLATRPIQPAKVTYWEFNRPKPFYLKAGAGYPLNSVLDFYASTQNPGTGYVVGYVNHEGRYAKIENDLGLKHPSTRMFNRIGVAAGKYFGKRTLEGDISYDNRLYHRYGNLLLPEVYSTTMPGSRVDFGDARASFRFGDDFKDLTRTNFEVGVDAGLFGSYPEVIDWTLEDSQIKTQALDANGRQFSFGGHAKVARGFGRHRLAAGVGYDQQRGGKLFEGIRQQQIHALLRYGYEGGVVAFEVGADYYYDRLDGDAPSVTAHDEEIGWNPKAKSYLIPFARVDFNLGTEGIKPFLELDGGVCDNSHRSLSLLNPYVNYNLWGDRSSVDYNGRFGVGGSLWRNRFTYRVYAGFSIRDNHLYWYNLQVGSMMATDTRYFKYARQTVTSFNGEAEWRPVSPLLVSLGLHGYLYNDDTYLANGAPAFDGRIGVSYQARKFSIGVSTLLQSKREWVGFTSLSAAPDGVLYSPFTVPFAADLRLNVDWQVSRSITLFAEGRNLANQKLYELPMYRDYGANFTLGIKANF